jgi:hypothetical protein
MSFTIPTKFTNTSRASAVGTSKTDATSQSYVYIRAVAWPSTRKWFPEAFILLYRMALCEGFIQSSNLSKSLGLFTLDPQYLEFLGPSLQRELW